MANKEIKTRIQNKNDTSENWAKAINFVPLKGEIIIYNDLRLTKIGDGVTKVGALEFANSKDAETLTGASLSTILNHSDVEIPTSKVVLDALDGKVDKVDGKSLSTEDYTTEEKNKLSHIESGANKTTVDSSLSSTSTNPVQNKVINTKFTSVQSDIDSKVPNTRTVNGKALSTNITLSASDVGALPDTTVIPSIDGLATKTYVDTKQTKITASGILKGNGAGGVSAAVKGTDYAGPSIGVSVTLRASDWNANTKTQTVSVAGVTATANGSLPIAQSTTDEQFTAWGAAQPRVTAQAAGTLTVKAAGTVPTIDIPVEVLIV